MPTHVHINIAGRSFNPKGSRLHSMSYGMMDITPRNLDQALLQMQSESAGNMGSMAGKRQHKPFTVTREVDSASPLFFRGLATNAALQSVTVSFTKPGSSAGGQEEVYPRITLTNATIASYTRFHPSRIPRHSASGSESTHTNELEQVAVTFQKILITSIGNKNSASDDWESS